MLSNKMKHYKFEVWWRFVKKKFRNAQLLIENVAWYLTLDQFYIDKRGAKWEPYLFLLPKLCWAVISIRAQAYFLSMNGT